MAALLSLVDLYGLGPRVDNASQLKVSSRDRRKRLPSSYSRIWLSYLRASCGLRTKSV